MANKEYLDPVSVDITVYSPIDPSYNFADTIFICEDEKITLKVEQYSGYGILWDNGSSFSERTIAYKENAGSSISFVVYSNESCTLEKLYWIEPDTSQNCNTSTIDENILENNNLLIFPNPDNGIFNLEFSPVNNEAVSIEIYDNMGKLVFVKKYNTTSSNFTTQINLSKLSKGSYFLKATLKEEIINKLIIIN